MTGVNATYTTNIPFASNNPSADQPIMEQNTNSINSVLSVDHISFNTSNNQGGYHNVIHMPAQGSKPATVPTIFQVFSMVPPSGIPSSDNQLFTITGAGGFEQMSGNQASTNGAVWCAGILIQWGQKIGGGAVTFPFTFPNSCFNVQATPYTSVVSPSTVQMLTVNPSFTTSGFSFNLTPSSGQVQGFFWIAIGN